MLREAQGSVTRSPLIAAGLQAQPCVSTAPDQLQATLIHRVDRERAQQHRQR